MGACFCVSKEAQEARKRAERKLAWERQLQLQHFMSPTFPIKPRLRKHSRKLMAASWELIKQHNFVSENSSKSGLVFVLDQLMERLSERDIAFRTVFPHMKIQARMLAEMMKILLKLDYNSPGGVYKELTEMSEYFVENGFRLVHFPAFFESFLQAVSHCLGLIDATELREEFGLTEIAAGWINTIAVALKVMVSYQIFNKNSRTRKGATKQKLSTASNASMILTHSSQSRSKQESYSAVRANSFSNSRSHGGLPLLVGSRLSRSGSAMGLKGLGFSGGSGFAKLSSMESGLSGAESHNDTKDKKIEPLQSNGLPTTWEVASNCNSP